MWVDIENSSGTRLGAGPLRACTHWRQTRRLDRAGEFTATVAATDPRVALATAKRVLRCRARLAGGVVEVGAGVLDKRAVGGATGPDLSLELSGDDLLTELVDRSVGFLKLNDGSGGPATDALAQIMAVAPAGWTLDTTLGYASTGAPVYVEFAGESVLAALGKVAELTGEHFRLGTGRAVTWLRTDRPSSGVRAVAAGEGRALAGNPLIVLIKDLQLDYDSHDVVTRVYPWGAGNANARVDMAATTRTAPAGYTLDLVNNWLEWDVATLAYGRVERHVSIKELNQQGTASADAVSAANALFDAALLYLEAHGAEQVAYQVDLVKVPGVILPGQLIRVVYRRTVDGYAAVNLNADLLILESQTEVDADGLWTTGLTVANSDRWPTTDADLLAGAIGQARAMEAHPQPSESAGIVTDPHVAYRNQANTFTSLQTLTGGLTVGSVPMGAGTSFPGSPVAGQAFYRSDLHRWGFYDGARWLSEPYVIQLHDYTAGAQPYGGGGEKLVAAIPGDVALRLLYWQIALYYGSGDGSNYWSIELRSLNGGIGFDSHATISAATLYGGWYSAPAITSFTNNPVPAGGRWLQLFTAATGAPSPLYVINYLRVADVLT